MGIEIIIITVNLIGAIGAVLIAKALNPMFHVDQPINERNFAYDGLEVVCSVDVDFVG